MLPDGLNWLCYFAGSSKSYRENSISFMFLEFSHQVDVKNVVKSSKHFFGYFNTLETHSAQCSEWVSKPKFFLGGYFDFNVAFSMYIMTMSSQKLLICHENIVKMVLNPVHLEHFS